MAAFGSAHLQVIGNFDNGMVQVAVDTLDTDISCPNTKLYTHSFAMMLMQHQKLTEASASDSMNQLTHTKSKLPKKMVRQKSFHIQV